MFPYWTVTEKWTRIHEFQESVQALLSSSVRGFRRVCLSNSSRDFSVVVLSIFYFSCCCCDSVFIQTSVDYIIFMCAKSEVDAAAVHRTNQPSSLSTGWTLLVAAELWNFPPTSEMKALLFGRMRIGATFRRLVESLETMSGEKNVMLKKTKKNKLVTLKLKLRVLSPTSRCGHQVRAAFRDLLMPKAPRCCRATGRPRR